MSWREDPDVMRWFTRAWGRRAAEAAVAARDRELRQAIEALPGFMPHGHRVPLVQRWAVLALLDHTEDA